MRDAAAALRPQEFLLAAGRGMDPATPLRHLYPTVPTEDLRTGDVRAVVSRMFLYAEPAKVDAAGLGPRLDRLAKKFTRAFRESFPEGPGQPGRMRNFMTEPLSPLGCGALVYLYFALCQGTALALLWVGGFRGLLGPMLVSPPRRAVPGRRHLRRVVSSRVISLATGQAERLHLHRHTPSPAADGGGDGARQAPASPGGQAGAGGGGAAGSNAGTERAGAVGGGSGGAGGVAGGGGAPPGGAAASESGGSSAGADAAGPRPAQEDVPILYLHGIGPGLITHVAALSQLRKEFPGVTIFAPQLRYVSCLLGARTVSPDAEAERCVEYVRARGFERFVLVAQSYGTLVGARVVKCYPERVHNVVMLDPAALMLCSCDALDALAYRARVVPAAREWLKLSTWFDRGCTIVFAGELAVRHTICRRLLWSRSHLPVQLLPDGATVVVGQDDALLPARSILDSLALDGKPGIRVVVDPSWHGNSILHDVVFDEVVDKMRAFWEP